MPHPKKVGTLPVNGGDELKQTNEIGMFMPLLDAIDIQGKDITADALLTQRKLATYLVERKAHYHFTVKGNQPTLQADIALLFQDRKGADFVSVSPPDHGRIETRRIWCSNALNAYLDFPQVGQVFLIEREVLHKKSGKRTLETAIGVTSRPPEQASPQKILAINRGHWSIESVPQAHRKEVQYGLTNCVEATRKMRVGPSGSAFRSGPQTTPSCCGQESWW
ncbi:MAG TPA: ISAs1 family transposase [Accumulibacter sp.]|nr:ISAs1 family transposase [Accumulibacter sp.]